MYPSLGLGLLLLASTHLSTCLSAADIPRDTPISSLISSANENLAKGNYNDALTYFDEAISHDPKNYLTIFKRGATYLSLGKTAQASQDFDRVLSIKPDFEGALLQRAKIKQKNCDWAGAKRDYVSAGRDGGVEVTELDEAATAAQAATSAAEQGNWEECVTQAGLAIMTASTCLELRKLRARCRFEKAEVREGVSDLQHVLQIDAQGSTEPHLQISAMLFYSLAETERGMAQIRKCLHSDPDSKVCSRLFRREKSVDKRLAKVKSLMEKRQFAGAAKVLIKTSEDDLGLVQDVRDDIKELREEGIIHQKAPDGLVGVVVELACEAYTEVCLSISPKQRSIVVQLTLPSDEQHQKIRSLLRRSLTAQRALSASLTLQSAIPHRRRRIRTCHVHAEHGQRTPPILSKSPITPPKSTYAAPTVQDQRLLQDPRRVS